jgi:iron complex outermembrane recepter protein
MSKRLFQLFQKSIFGLIFVFGNALCVCAQETNQEEFTLEEITVTAQKRVENQQKVPIAMDVISGETMQTAGQDNVDKILQNLSNSMVNMASDGMRVTLRGLSDTTEAWNNMRVSTPTVAINMDGAYNTGNSAGQNLFDLERVEVLYGPQSTLYGSNSPGGIVNIVTASPKTDRYSASGSVEVGSYNKYNVQAAFNAPIVSDKVAMRLAVQKSKQGSWLDGGSDTSRNTSARLKTLYQANDKLSITVTGTWSLATTGGMTGGNVDPFDYQDGHYSNGSDVKNPWTSSSSSLGMAGGGGGGDQHSKGLNGEIAWETPIGALSIVPSWSKDYSSNTSSVTVYTDGSHTSSVSTIQTTDNSTVQKNAEIRLTSPQDFFFNWIMGATYYKSQRQNKKTDWYYSSNDLDQTADETNKGLYGNATYPVTEKLRATAGLRMSWDDTSMVATGTGGTNAGQPFHKPDVKLGMEYDVSESNMVYGNYSTSYRVNNDAGGVRGSTTVTRTVPAERMVAFTVGTKSRFFSNKVQLNTSAYLYNYKNKRFSAIGRAGQLEAMGTSYISELDYWYVDSDGTLKHPDLDFDGDNTDTALQGIFEDPYKDQYGSFRSVGVDVSANWVVTNADRVNLSLSYLNAKWKEAKLHYYWNTMWEQEGWDFSGMRNTYSPTWSGTVSYQHNFIVGEYGMLIPQVDLQAKSSYKLSLMKESSLVASGYSPKINYQEGYYLVNGSLTFSHASGIWNLNVYVKNATNYAVKTYINENGNAYTLGLNDPRTFGGVLSVKF